MGPYVRWIILAVGLVCIVFLTNNSSTSKKYLPSRILFSKEDAESLTIDTSLGKKKYSQLEEEVFTPMGYKIREPSMIPSLDFLEKPNCPKVFSDWLARSLKQNESAVPPRIIPAELRDQYTLKGNVHLIEDYMDNRSGTQRSTWTKQMIDQYIAMDVSSVTNYDGEGRAMYHAMKEYGVKGKKGVVVGSLTPWVEAFALKLGAQHVTTVEYMSISIPDDSRVDYKHPLEIAKNAEKHIGAYDFVSSFSSLEHSGLGRFGDALDPIGDLREALKVYCMLKENGYFFVSFPVGWDTVHWNLHRIYGRIRIALFAAGFDVVDMFYRESKKPISKEMFEKPGKLGAHTQPVLILRKR